MRRLLIALALILTVAQHAAAAANYERLFAKVDPAVAVIVRSPSASMLEPLI